MDIILYLTELLHTRKTVGLVGLGTLYKKKSPGKYDANQHAFIPPTYTLAFTPDIKEEEELADYISNKRNITGESANYYINEFVEQIQAQLADQQEADFGTFGKLKLINDELTLVAAQEGNFGYEFYGLPTLPEVDNKVEAEYTAPIIEEEKLEDIEEENKLEEENPGQETPIEDEYISLNDDQPVYDEIAEIDSYPVIGENDSNNSEKPVITVEDEEEYFEEEEEEEQKKATPFFIKFLIVFLLIVAAGSIAYFINPHFFDKYIQKNFEGKPSKNVPIVPNDSLKIKIDSNQIDSVAKNNAMVILVKDSTVLDSTKTYYEVMGTSENSKAAADKYIARVAKKGIIAKHIKLSKIRFGVSLGTFTDDKEALKYRDSTRVLLRNQGIYIWIIKPKKHTK